jgi:signal transduction histidine kinase
VTLRDGRDQWPSARAAQAPPGPATSAGPAISPSGYRLVQEALTNVVKHASADGVKIRVSDAG